ARRRGVGGCRDAASSGGYQRARDGPAPSNSTTAAPRGPSPGDAPSPSIDRDGPRAPPNAIAQPGRSRRDEAENRPPRKGDGPMRLAMTRIVAPPRAPHRRLVRERTEPTPAPARPGLFPGEPESCRRSLRHFLPVMLQLG